MLTYREIRQTDDKALAGIIRTNLKAHGLDIPGTVYFDDNLDHLSDFYLEDKSERYYLIALKDDKVLQDVQHPFRLQQTNDAELHTFQKLPIGQTLHIEVHQFVILILVGSAKVIVRVK